MIFTTRMIHLNAFVLDHDTDKVTRELLKQSLLHFVKITQLKDRWLNKVKTIEPGDPASRITEIKKRIESFLSLIGATPAASEQLDINKLSPLNLDEIEEFINKLAEKIDSTRLRQEKINHEILKLQDIGRQIDLFGDIKSMINARDRYSFLSIQLGSIPVVFLDNLTTALKDTPSVVLEMHKQDKRIHLLIISMRRDDALVQGIIDKFNWVDTELKEEIYGVLDDVTHNLDAKMKILSQEQQELQNQTQTVITDERDRLSRTWAALRLNELYNSVQSYFSKTARTMLFSGWLPAARLKELEQGIKKATSGRCYLQWSDPVTLEKKQHTKEVVPVELKTPKILSPFQMLVKNYALPEYGSIDPTPFVALAYLCMFGLMFGDAGQGAILVLCGLFASFFFKNRNRNFFYLSQLIIWCGTAAIIAGILFGSYFGWPWFKPLWFDYHNLVLGHSQATGFIHDIYGVLAITLYFGIIVIGVGIILNWINLIVKRKWLKLFMDKAGILGSWIYFGGVYIAHYFVIHQYKELPSSDLLFLIIGIPALLFLIKPPIIFFLQKKADPGKKLSIITLFNFLLEWLIEMLEIFSGYLANTLSFMRVAGLGIAHACLMIAFFEMAGMAGGGIWSVIILIIGNLLVIALEGLSAGIQSLRLNYYEFFSKYFTGTGMAYSPVSLYRR